MFLFRCREVVWVELEATLVLSGLVAFELIPDELTERRLGVIAVLQLCCMGTDLPRALFYFCTGVAVCGAES